MFFLLEMSHFLPFAWTEHGQWGCRRCGQSASGVCCCRQHRVRYMPGLTPGDFGFSVSARMPCASRCAHYSKKAMASLGWRRHCHPADATRGAEQSVLGLCPVYVADFSATHQSRTCCVRRTRGR